MGQDIRGLTRELLERLDRRPGSLMPILQEVQSRFGYLPEEAVVEVAAVLHIPRSAIYGVATFYNQFRLHPPGRHQVKMCLGTACHIKGGQAILESWERELGVRMGQTTADRGYSLERVACVGCCAMAPVTVVDEEPQGRMTPIKVKGLILSRKLLKEKEQQGEAGEAPSAETGR